MDTLRKLVNCFTIACVALSPVISQAQQDPVPEIGWTLSQMFFQGTSARSAVQELSLDATMINGVSVETGLPNPKISWAFGSRACWSHDSKFAYRIGSFGIMSHNALTGSTELISSQPANGKVVRISPDGKILAIIQDEGTPQSPILKLTYFNLPTKTMLGTYPLASSLANDIYSMVWMPNGSGVVFSGPRVIRLNGQQGTPFVEASGRPFSIKPDSSEILSQGSPGAGFIAYDTLTGNGRSCPGIQGDDAVYVAKGEMIATQIRGNSAGFSAEIRFYRSSVGNAPVASINRSNWKYITFLYDFKNDRMYVMPYNNLHTGASKTWPIDVLTRDGEAPYRFPRTIRSTQFNGGQILSLKNFSLSDPVQHKVVYLGRVGTAWAEMNEANGEVLNTTLPSVGVPLLANSSPSGKYIVSLEETPTISLPLKELALIDTVTRTRIAKKSNPESSDRLVVSDAGLVASINGSQSRIEVYSPNFVTGTFTLTRTWFAHDVADMALSPGGDRIAYTDGPSSVVIKSIATGSELSRVSFGGSLETPGRLQFISERLLYVGSVLSPHNQGVATLYTIDSAIGIQVRRVVSPFDDAVSADFNGFVFPVASPNGGFVMFPRLQPSEQGTGYQEAKIRVSDFFTGNKLVEWVENRGYATVARNSYFTQDGSGFVTLSNFPAPVKFKLPAFLDELLPQVVEVVGGNSLQLRVRLTSPAPAGGASVKLSTAVTGVMVPPAVVVPQGQREAVFEVMTSGVQAPVAAEISSEYRGSVRKASFRILPPTALSVSAGPVDEGGTAEGRVTLNGRAGPSGLTVRLFTSLQGAIQVPATVVVNPGARTAAFQVTALNNPASYSVGLSSSIQTLSLTGSTTVIIRPKIAVTFASSAVPGGQSVLMTVRLGSPAPTGGALATLIDNSPLITVPGSVAFTAGQSQRVLLLRTLSTLQASEVVVQAAAPGYAGGAGRVTLLPPSVSSLTPATASVKGGNDVVLTLTLDTPVPAGFSLSTSCSNTLAARPPLTVSVPAGQTTVSVVVKTLVQTANRTARVTIGGKTVTLTVTP